MDLITGMQINAFPDFFYMLYFKWSVNNNNKTTISFKIETSFRWLYSCMGDTQYKNIAKMMTVTSGGMSNSGLHSILHNH